MQYVTSFVTVEREKLVCGREKIGMNSELIY